MPKRSAAGGGSSLPIRRSLERRSVVLSAAALLTAAIFAWRQINDDPGNGISVLYVVPVAMVALELGLAAGLAAAAIALGLVGLWALTAGIHLGVLGLVTRGVGFFAIASVAGMFSDRMRAVQRRQGRLLDSGLALSHLAAEEDLSRTLAESARELVGATGARVELQGRPPVETGRLGSQQDWIPIEVRGVEYGTLTVAVAGELAPEDRATLVLLALQAAVAVESQHHLELERERALLGAELHETRTRLDERSRQMRELVVRQEAERHDVADQLHEESAQTMAAVLLGLRALERQLETGQADPTLGPLRSTVDETLQSLRSLAVRLRPPVLALGLRAALESLAGDAQARGLEDMSVELRDVTDLPEEAETMVYRAVEEALASVPDCRSVVVRTLDDESKLIIDVRSASPIDPSRLTVLEARLDLVGATLSTTDGTLRAVIPLPSGEDHAPHGPAEPGLDELNADV